MYEGIDLKDDKVWSVGKTPEAAIRALCMARLGSSEDVVIGEDLPLEVPFTWGKRFKADGGTGFKAAGIHVPGGVILTWWK